MAPSGSPEGCHESCTKASSSEQMKSFLSNIGSLIVPKDSPATKEGIFEQ
jgi:hypothetical protein